MKLASATIADELMEGRTLILMGAGRSGTTILGTLIASMHPVFYLFEPVLMRIMFQFCHAKPLPDFDRALKSVLMEDYLLPQLHGRRLDTYRGDRTFWGYHDSEKLIRWRNKTIRTRNESIGWAAAEHPLWLIKHPEFQALAPTAERFFPGVRFIHIVRNGMNAVASAVSRNWYGDHWCNRLMVEWTVGDHGCPWYLSAESKAHWPKWDPATRAACVWRTATSLGMDFCNGNPATMQIRYEADLCKEPWVVAKTLASELNVRITQQTRNCIRSIEEFPHKGHEPVAIQEPERTKFQALMQELSYL